MQSGKSRDCTQGPVAVVGNGRKRCERQKVVVLYVILNVTGL